MEHRGHNIETWEASSWTQGKIHFGCVVWKEEEPITHWAYYGEFMEETGALGLPSQREFHQWGYWRKLRVTVWRISWESTALIYWRMRMGGQWYWLLNWDRKCISYISCTGSWKENGKPDWGEDKGVKGNWSFDSTSEKGCELLLVCGGEGRRDGEKWWV